jgi:mannose-6-phosphate isomerase-like protein (cupin superfamily)
VDGGYEHGWARFSFAEPEFSERRVHGSTVPIRVRALFNRGRGQPFVSAGIIPATSPEPGIGLHVHRDLDRAADVEEWYIIVAGRGVMRFSNGDSVDVGPGDFITTYPGTGHSLQATGEDHLRMISITPQMFFDAPVTEILPARPAPAVAVVAVDSATMGPVRALCARCGLTWERPADRADSNVLADWARAHGCTGSRPHREQRNEDSDG